MHLIRIAARRLSIAGFAVLILLASRSVAGGEEAAAPADQPALPAEHVEFFESRVRPLLIKRCHECHAGDDHEAGLRLDSPAAALRGGDTGPAIIPGEPDKSELIRAIRYDPEGYQMPPAGKLPDEEIATLTRWVAMGAPWPGTADRPDAAVTRFDLDERASRWSFQPLQRPRIPQVADAGWCRNPVDRFLLARLREQELVPAARADARTLARRAAFDVLGLPPAPDQLQRMIADPSAASWEQAVDALLSSPHFGERWGRHWLDLVRYAESRGHEFDYDVANAHEYRDYVLRALNDDVPYDQLVVEHVAGDLLTSPEEPSSADPSLDVSGRSPSGSRFPLRTRPLSGANESILGTGFWFLGEWVHSPVDIRGEEAERFANMIDVYSKTFLGLTVACARCHDHKFDPISARDFYALQGYLQSSCYQQSRFETMESNRRLARELAVIERQAARDILPIMLAAARPVIDRMDAYLTAAIELIQEGLDVRLPEGEAVFADFESGTYAGWTARGDAFGTGPQTLDTIARSQQMIQPVGRFFVNSHQRRDGGRGDAHVGTLTSEPFVISREFIRFGISGGAHAGKTCVNLLIDDEIVETTTGRNDNTLHPVTWSVGRWRGREARIQLVDAEEGGWGHIGVDHIVFSDRGSTTTRPLNLADLPEATRARIEAKAGAAQLDAAVLCHWIAFLQSNGGAGSELRSALMDSAAEPVARDADVAGRDGLAEGAPSDWLAPSADVETDFDGRHLRGEAPRGEPSVDWLGSPRPLRLSENPSSPIGELSIPAGVMTLSPFGRGSAAAAGGSGEPGATADFPPGPRLRTPTFALESGKVHCLIRGGVNTYLAVDSHVLIKGPLHGILVQRHPAPETPGWRWVTLDGTRYAGHRASVEFSPRPGEEFAICRIVQSPSIPAGRPPSLITVWEDSTSPRASAVDAARSFATTLRQQFEALAALAARDDSLEWLADDTHVPAGLLWQWLVDTPHLFGLEAPAARRSIEAASDPWIIAARELTSDLRSRSATAPGMADGSGEEEYVFIRGNWKKRGEVVPRRFLEVFDRMAVSPEVDGSGRLELAEQMVDPEQTPILPRVIVNRLWQHYFGTGLVPTPDDFGHMGQDPSHPELLDWLASELVAHDWSLKHVHRLILTSAAYQMSSAASEPRVVEQDPANRWLARMNVKRLEGEAIRDAVLALSGRLDRQLYGPSVPVYLTSFMEGRGRPPQSGPVDGAGRRSVYVAVRRNFPDPFFQAFDMPNPHTTVGRRNVSNVPAQALAMMNNPFVVEQADRWARRLLSDLPEGTPAERIELAYHWAVSRAATPEETAAAVAFLSRQADEFDVSSDDARVWADLCHVLLNSKEFLFIQ